MSREPRRYTESGEGASPEAAFMHALIRTERTALPSEEQLAKIEDRLGPILTRSQANGRASSGMPLRMAPLVAVAAVVALTAGTFAVRSRPEHGPHSQVSAVGSSNGTAEDPRPTKPLEQPPFEPSRPVTTTRTVESLPPASATPRPSAVASAVRPTCTDEVTLLERADAALRSGDGAGALTLTNEHAVRCATGAFVQERERIAIEALGTLGRFEEMRGRARGFEDRYPASPHIRHIRRIVDDYSK